VRAPFDADFEEWWRLFPRKIGKLAARKEYDKVRRGGITQDELIDGIAQYLAAKPDYADLCHPRTFLSQGRWMDEPPAAKVYEPWTCPHTPRCPHRAACQIVSLRVS
jgi:hypothetical protein